MARKIKSTMTHKSSRKIPLLELLVSSKVRRSIVQHFLHNRPGQWHLRELARMLKTSVNPVKLELARLERGGFLKSHREANKRVYRLNPESPFLAQMSIMTVDGQEEQKRAENASKAAILAAQEQSQALRQESDQVTARLEMAVRNEETIREELHAARKTVSERDRQIQGIQAETTALRQQLQDELTSAQQQRSALELKIAESEQAMAAAKEQFSAREQEIAQNQEQSGQLEQQLAEFSAKKKEWEAQIEQAKQQFSAKEQELTAATKKQSQLQTQLEDLQIGNANREDELQRARETLAAIRADLIATQSQVVNAQEQSAAAEERLATAMAEMDIIRNRQSFEAGWPTAAAAAGLILLLGLVGWWIFTLTR